MRFNLYSYLFYITYKFVNYTIPNKIKSKVIDSVSSLFGASIIFIISSIIIKSNIFNYFSFKEYYIFLLIFIIIGCLIYYINKLFFFQNNNYIDIIDYYDRKIKINTKLQIFFAFSFVVISIFLFFSSVL
jgi:hypothetical protein